MATSPHRGTTAIDRLRSRFETTEPTCPACGFDDSDGEWTAKTDGSRILYRHVCPRCGKIRTRTYRLGGDRDDAGAEAEASASAKSTEN